MSVPTEPGWYRVRFGDVGSAWSVRQVFEREGLRVGTLTGNPSVLLSEYHCQEWGARVEFQGDEPDLWRRAALDASSEVARLRAVIDDMRGRAAAAIVAKGPLTPDSEGWWWRWVDAVGQFDEGDWYPTRVASDIATPPGLVYGYGAVKDDGRWGGRAVPPVTPAVEADEREADPQRNQLPPGWTIERLEHGAWWCAERATPPTPITGFSRASWHDAIAAAWDCVTKREAPPAGWRVVLTLVGDWRALRDGDLESSSVFETHEEALAHARAVADAGPVDEPEAVPLVTASEFLESCGTGERREVLTTVGDVSEARIVDRRDEP